MEDNTNEFDFLEFDASKTQSCSSANPCPIGEGLGCYRACTSNADCVDGNCNSTTELCETGRCLPIVSKTCTENSDCPGGYYCSSNYCVPSKTIGTCDPGKEATCESPHKCVTNGFVKGCCHASATAVQLVGDPNSPSIVCCESAPCGDGFCCDKDHPCINGTCHRSVCEGVQCFNGQVCYEGQCVSPNCNNNTVYCPKCINDQCCPSNQYCNYPGGAFCCAAGQNCCDNAWCCEENQTCCPNRWDFAICCSKNTTCNHLRGTCD